MVLIIGGAYQGKREQALGMGFAEAQIVGDVAGLIRQMLDGGRDPLAEMPMLADAWQDKAVLLEDIACGVVPMDAKDRAWREAVGRCGAYLARRADTVVRVFCGIGTVLRDA